MDEAQLRAFFEKDRYAAQCGITIDEIEEGKAVCSFEVKPKHLNAGDAVQGGAIFTLADFAFAVASNSDKEHTVSLENQITFMHGTRGNKLIATAYRISSAREVCFYQVDVADEKGRAVARMTVTGYVLEKKEKDDH